MWSRNWVERYVGIPFQDVGFGFSGCNCWTLVRLVLLTECKIELPLYGETSADDLRAAGKQIGSNALIKPWLSVVGDRRTFDAILMSARLSDGGSFPGHVGIMTSPTHLLHVERATDAVNIPIDHPSVRQRIIGAFRHEALA